MGMAKAKTFDAVIQNITDNYENLLSDAVKSVAKRAEKEIYDKSVDILYEYYYGAYEPKSYDRTFALQRSFIPFTKISKRDTELECVVGVEYDPWVLEEYVGAVNDFAYDASKKYGQVDGDWVIDNFLQGKHPYTDGSSQPGTPVKYRQSKLNQGTEMKRYLNYYAYSIFPRAVIVEMINRVPNMMRR